MKDEVKIRTYVQMYGLLPPTSGAVEAREQIRLGNRYRNDLVAVERARRAFADSLVRPHPVVVAAEIPVRYAQDALNALRDALRERRVVAQKEALPTDIERARISEAEKACEQAWRALKVARKLVRDERHVELSEAQEKTVQLEKGAYRAMNGAMVWGNRGVVDASHEQVRKMPMYDGLDPNMPRFQRRAGEGRIAVQLIGGLSTQDLLGCQDTQVRLEMLPHLTDKRGGPQYGVLWLRVGSNADRTPVWAKFPTKIHRPLPLRAKIKWAIVSVKRIGPREQWRVGFSLDEPAPKPKAAKIGSAVAVVVGWRRLDDGSEYACHWRAEDGAEGALVLDADMLSVCDYADELRSIRDTDFDLAKTALRAWLDTRTVAGHPEDAVADHPAWMRERTRALHMWRSPARLVGLANYWSENRYAGDDLAFAFFAGAANAPSTWHYKPGRPWRGWCFHDRHLWAWEAEQRQRFYARRKDFYRRFAAQLAEERDVLVLDNTDLRVFAEEEEIENRQRGQHESRAHRALAAPSELRTCLEHAFVKRGRLVIKLPAAKGKSRAGAAEDLCERFRADKKALTARAANPTKRQGRFQRRKQEKAAKLAAEVDRSQTAS